MKYQVQVIETVVQTRSLEVEADTPAAAHRLAYEAWVDNGRAELESEAVESRWFHLTDAAGKEFEAEDACFHTEPEPQD